MSRAQKWHLALGAIQNVPTKVRGSLSIKHFMGQNNDPAVNRHTQEIVKKTQEDEQSMFARNVSRSKE